MQMITTFPKITSLFIESNDAIGPFGAKGIGEPAFMPPPAAIANAVYNAAGIRLKSLPMTPKKVLEALKQA
jgi:CO/xanthine dehydrogenase Mo-binding subunit